MPNLFNAHTELRRLLLGRDTPVPFTPIHLVGLPFLADAPSSKPVASPSSPLNGDFP